MKISIFISIFFITVLIYSQQNSKIDSLIKLSKYDDALQLALHDLEILKGKSTPLLLGKTQSEIASIYFKKVNYDSTYYYAKKALALGIEHDLPEVIASAYIPIGNIHYSKFEDLDAITIYQKIDSVSQYSGLKNKHVIKSMFNLGEVLLRTYSVQDTSYISKAEGYFKRAIKMASEINDEYHENYGYVLMGNIYGQRRQYDKAMPFYEKSILYFKNKGFFKDLARIYWSLGIINTDLKLYDKADAYYRLRLKVLTETGDRSNIAAANRTYAGFLYRIENYEKAIKYFEEAYNVYSKSDTGKSGILVGITKNLAESYLKVGDFKKSSEFYKLAMIYKDSLETRKQRNLALDLEKKYQTEKKEQEISVLTSQNELVQQQKKNQRNLLLGGIGITSLAGLFFFLLYRNRQKTNKKLNEIDTLKSKFFVNISHEFRTPLTLILTPIEKKLASEKLNKADREEFEMMQRNSKRLLSLVDQLLDLSKLESGNLKLRVIQGNLSPHLKSITSSFQYLAKQKGIKYSVKVGDLKNIWFDRNVIEKIVINLLSNAFKYTPDNGLINFETTINKDYLEVNIENTGATFPKEKIDQIFNRFYQVDANADGVGIGLSLVKELVALSYGEITVENTTNNRIQFKVVLPITENDFNKDELVRSKPVGTFSTDFEPDIILTQGRKDIDPDPDIDQPILLIVEDNPDIRCFVNKSFSGPYQVLEARNGKIGIEKAIKFVPDIIISDIMMPETNGLELCKQLKLDERTCHIPIILLTARAGEEDQYKGLEIGADDYIKKPFRLKLLQTRVQNLVTSRKLLRDRYSQELILKPRDIAITNLDEQFLERMQTVLDKKLTEPSLNVEEFSKLMRMSRMQLHRKLKSLLGVSTTEFIRNERLKSAAELLKNTNIGIAEAAYSVGFSEVTYFSKCFKKIYGLSPSAFRKDN